MPLAIAAVGRIVIPLVSGLAFALVLGPAKEVAWMVRTALSIGLYTLGASALLIGTLIFVLGAATTVSIFESLFSLFGAELGAVDDFRSANVDSELRFYAVFWIAYGAILIHTAQDFSQRFARVPLLLGLFFVGGIGRCLSYLLVGPPHVLFIVLMIIELALPPILYAAYLAARAD